MGEAVISSAEFEDQEAADVAHRTTENKKMSTADVAGSSPSSSCVVRWERFLPKMVVRVLLVEADDSTRQIITALLRKCSYRVAAVADGLKAWELLKGRPHNIDLILTEVELPLISGYALLTLIMGHDVCKNIPVIMMSSNDSVSMVYKCMLRGAADFLVKPVRKNELRNLWQHVWRKQASSNTAAAGGPGQPDESVAQQKVEAMAENNAVSSNHSSGFISCAQRNRECIEKGSDAQSSCTKPELENEEAGADITISDEIHISRQGLCHQEKTENPTRINEAGGSRAVSSSRQDKKSNDDVIVRDSENHHHQILESYCVEAIDLIGPFATNNRCLKGVVENDSKNKCDVLRQVDLSLRRSHPSASVNETNDENCRLNHSVASAFSRYINRPFNPGNSTSSPSTQNNQHRDYETDSGKQLSNNPTLDYNSDTHGPKSNYQNHHSSTSKIESGQGETSFSYHHQREISQPVRVRGVRLNGYGSLMPEIYRGSCLPSPGTPNHPSKSLPQSSNCYNLMDRRVGNNDLDRNGNEQGQHMESDQHGDSGYYASNTSHYRNTDSGNNLNESGNEERGLNNHVHEGAASSAHRSMQREAALTKFRLKRKGRCFEKKVRYESRKKLAEQRPRVKGQFVRQVPDSQPGNSSAG